MRLKLVTSPEIEKNTTEFAIEATRWLIIVLQVVTGIKLLMDAENEPFSRKPWFACLAPDVINNVEYAKNLLGER